MHCHSGCPDPELSIYCLSPPVTSRGSELRNGNSISLPFSQSAQQELWALLAFRFESMPTTCGIQHNQGACQSSGGGGTHQISGQLHPTRAPQTPPASSAFCGAPAVCLQAPPSQDSVLAAALRSPGAWAEHPSFASRPRRHSSLRLCRALPAGPPTLGCGGRSQGLDGCPSLRKWCKGETGEVVLIYLGATSVSVQKSGSWTGDLRTVCFWV